MPIAILDPFSGIAGDMTLGALVDVGLDPEWLRALPARLGLDGVGVDVRRVQRAGIGCTKVDFAIPPQPHGRSLTQIQQMIGAADLPATVRERAARAFTAIAEVEGGIHGVPAEKVHLHEVGAVDAILDVVGSIWGFAELGVERVYCGPIALGEGTVQAAHGTLPVPAPATLRLLEGLPVRPGPAGAGELTTPTGGALVRVLSAGPPPASYVPLRSGFGAGTKDPAGRPNALRLILANAGPGAANGGSSVEDLVTLAADLDDMPGEYVAAVADHLRSAGALDVVLCPTIMKKGRPGVRIEVLTRPAEAESLESMLFAETTTLGVRRAVTERRALPREEQTVSVLGQPVRVKVAVLPNGDRRGKPEYEDVARVATSAGRALRDVFGLAVAAWERMLAVRVP